MGGMGEVYRARDERLKRDVAIKVVHARFAADPDRVARFEQEAHAAAALNHPNVLSVYDVGTSLALSHSSDDPSMYIVSELLEGTTLRAALDQGALPISKVIDIGKQVAAGLAAAHSKGITHRDIKPENLFLTHDGRAKVLDFGLAKLREDAAGTSTATHLHASTEPGVVLGTVGYMSPEQVRGQPADARSDIFSFGVVLFEMLSGMRPFHRQSAVETMNAILNEDPAHLSAGGRALAPALDRIVRHCLEKNPDERFQSAQDLAFALQSSAMNESGSVAAVAPFAPLDSSRLRERIAWTAAIGLLLVSLALIAVVFMRRTPSAPASPLVRVEVPIPETAAITDAVGRGSNPLALSPDGRFLAFVASVGNTPFLWVRRLDSLKPTRLAGTEGARGPFWSPDSRTLAFSASGKLKRVDIAGGDPQVLCDTAALGGASWGKNDVIVFSPAYAGESGLVRVSARGGTVTPVTQLDATNRETNHAWPQFLPDGHHFLYNVGGREAGIYVGSLDSTARSKLMAFDNDATDVGLSTLAYAPPGFVLYVHGQTLRAYPIDLGTLTLSGPPVPIAEGVGKAGPGIAAYSVSETGVLAYWTGTGVPTSQLTWRGRDGAVAGSVGPPGGYTALALAPDESEIVVSRIEAATQSAIWVLGVTRDTLTKVTFDRVSLSPVWSRESRSIAYGSVRQGPPNLYRKAADGAGEDVLLFKSDRGSLPTDWCAGERAVVFEMRDAKTQFDIWSVAPTGEGKAVALLRTPSNERDARCSPNGQWLAYTSDESGHTEVYVTSFPAGEGKWPISTSGGTQPRWRGDGKELFYVAPDGTLMAVLVSAGTAFKAGTTSALFRLRGTSYDVTTNGQRFVTNEPVGPTTSPPITVVLNWTAQLNK
jgi:Tol biopolymer transport system component